MENSTLRLVKLFFSASLVMFPAPCVADSCRLAPSIQGESIPIPDRDPQGVESRIEIDSCNIHELQELWLNVQIEHSYQGDIKIAALRTIST